MTAEQLEATRREVEIRDTLRDLAPHQPEVAEVLTYLLAENRRLNRIIAGMEERVETRAALDSRGLAERVAYREYAQSGAYDPRD